MNDQKIFYNLIIDVSFVFLAFYYVAAQLLAGTYKGDGKTLVLIGFMAAASFSLPMLYSGLCGRFMDTDHHLSGAYVYHRIMPPVLVATVIWWIFGGMTYWKMFFKGDYRIYALGDSLYSVLRTPYCLFFYPMLLMLLIIYPFFKKLMEEKKYLRSMSILCFTICLLGSAISYITVFPDELGMVLAFAAYAMMAILVEHIEFKASLRILIYLAGLLAAAAVFMLTVQYSSLQGETDYTWVEESTIFVLIWLFAVLVLVRQMSRRLAMTNCRLLFWINELASSGYIFVISLYWSVLYLGSFPHVARMALLPRFFFLSVTSLLFSLAISAAINRLPVISQVTALFQEERPKLPLSTGGKDYSRADSRYFSR